MLQLRGENEQFSSLPSLRAIDHPRLSIITTDRPDSSQIVDLHVYVVPKNVWKDRQRLAQNEAMEDAISAGFVRVSPNMTIRELRKSIENSCGKESYFPRDFIYLRSVGRCMTKVKAKQEVELRVKNYRPPQTFAPEIYLLDGRQENNTQDLSSSPVSASSLCDVCGNHDGHRADHEKHRSRQKEPRSDPDEDQSDYERRRYPSNDFARSPSRLTQNYQRKPMRGGKQHTPLTASHEIFSHNSPPERQTRSKYRPIGSDPEESAAIFSDVTGTPSSNLPKLKEEQERLRRRQGELERMRRAAEEKRARSQRSEGDRSRSDAEDENDGKRMQSSFRGFKDRQNVSEQRRNTYRFDRANKDEEENKEERKTAMKKQPTYQNSRRQTFPMPQSILIKHDNSKPLNTKRSKPTDNGHDYENTRNEMIDTERRNAEMKRRRQIEEDEEKKKEKQLADQRRKDLFKGTNDDPEALRARHQEIHTRRLDLEKVREEVIKHLKNVHNRITLRRKEARDLWKKKYFNEKKKHPPLDERITTLRNELDQMHKKTVQTMEAEAKYAAQMGYTKEATAGNSIAQITRINYEIQDIRHQVEQAKLRLTTDVKLRNQAENECRTLKHELNQAKMNLNDIKSRAGP